MSLDPGENVVKKKLSDFFGREIKATNLGLESMATALEEQDVHVQRIDWKPPTQIYPNLMTFKGYISWDGHRERCNPGHA